MKTTLNSISLCIITKDEENNLPRCLESAHNYVAEIIVVDTGSKDKTISIAKDYEAKIVKHIWKEDFSAARNEGLKQAASDWILILDADEELPIKTGKKLIDLIADNETSAWTFTISSPVSQNIDTPILKHSSIRMFRNQRGYHFQGRVHEQIKQSIILQDPQAVIKNSQLKINHYGYIPTNKEKRRKKTLRNITLLKKELVNQPLDSFLNYNLGISYYMLKDLEKACVYFQIALDNIKEKSKLAAGCYRDYCVCLYEMGEFKKALELVDNALVYYPDYPDLYYLKGQIFLNLYRLEQAESNFKRCTDFKEHSSLYTTTEGITSFSAYENLAEIYQLQEKYSSAINYLTLSLQEKHSYQVLKKLFILLKKNKFTDKKIIDYLENTLRIKPTELIQLFYDTAEYASCISYINNLNNTKNAFSEKTQNSKLYKIKSLLHLKELAEAGKELQKLDLEQFEIGLILNCICRWLYLPSADIEPYLDSLSKKENSKKIISTCRIVNQIILSNDDIKKKTDLNIDLDKNIVEEMLEIASLLIFYGNEKSALKICSFINKKQKYPTYPLFLKKVLNKKRFKKALNIIEILLQKNNNLSAEFYYLAGLIYTEQNLFKKAFQLFHLANIKEPTNKLYKTLALEQLAKHFKQMLQKIAAKKDDPNLFKSLEKIALLEKKIALIKGGASLES